MALSICVLRPIISGTEKLVVVNACKMRRWGVGVIKGNMKRKLNLYTSRQYAALFLLS